MIHCDFTYPKKKKKKKILHIIIHMSCMIKLDLALHPEFPYAKSHDNPPPLHSWYSL